MEKKPDTSDRENSLIFSAARILGPLALQKFLQDSYSPSIEAQSVADPIYYDLINGYILIGEKGVAKHLAAGGDLKELRNLKDLLEDNDLDAGGYKFDSEQYANWGRDDYIKYGQWLSGVIDPHTKVARSLTVRILERASMLGLGPSPYVIRGGRFYNKISEYQKDLGLARIIRRNHYSAWTLETAVEHIEKVGAEEDCKPSIPILEKRLSEGKDEPTPRILRGVIGPLSLNKLYELAGYIDTRGWDNPRYLEWGVRYIDANGEIPTAWSMNTLSKQNKGPSSNGAITHFGSVGKFQRELVEFYERETQRRQTERHRTLREILEQRVGNTLPRQLFSEAQSEEDILIRYTKYKILDDLFPTIVGGIKIRLSSTGQVGNSFIAIVAQFSEDFPGHLIDEMKARSKEIGTFNQIFPEDLAHLKIDRPKKAIARVFIQRQP